MNRFVEPWRPWWLLGEETHAPALRPHAQAAEAQHGAPLIPPRLVKARPLAVVAEDRDAEADDNAARAALWARQGTALVPG